MPTRRVRRLRWSTVTTRASLLIGSLGRALVMTGDEDLRTEGEFFRELEGSPKIGQFPLLSVDTSFPKIKEKNVYLQRRLSPFIAIYLRLKIQRDCVTI